MMFIHLKGCKNKTVPGFIFVKSINFVPLRRGVTGKNHVTNFC